MCRARMYLHLTTLVLSALWGGLSAGCESPARAPKPAAITPSVPEDTPVCLGPGPVLFGDRPQDERVPFENRLITNLARHTFTSEGLDFDPDVYADEDLLVYASTRNSERPDVFLKRADGATLTQLTDDPADDIQPRFSPDGKRIVFCSNRAGSFDIWMINRDGTGLTQLTRDATDEVAPCWSPDGSQIAYTVWGQRSRQWEIWTLSIAQPGLHHFLVCGMFPAWSPDGSRLAFQRARQRGSRLFSVWTIDLVGGEARHPTELAQSDTAACIAPRWSLDGTQIVYCAVPDEADPSAANPRTPSCADLWLVALDSGLRMKLTDGADPALNPAWGSAGRIFFVSPRAGTENIWSLAVELGGHATAVAGTTQVSQVDSTATSEVKGD